MNSAAERRVVSSGMEVEGGLADEGRLLWTSWEAAGMGCAADRSVFSIGLEVEGGLADEGRVPENADVESLCKRVNVDWLEGTAGEMLPVRREEVVRLVGSIEAARSCDWKGAL